MVNEAKPWELNGEKVLVLSDAHQRIDWIQAVLEHEAGNFDQFLFNGDIIDSFDDPPVVAGTRATAKYYKWLLDNHHVTLGNHDAPVMESWSHNQQYKNKRPLLNACSGFTNSKSIDFNKELKWTDWEKVSLFRVVNGWLVSHAGFRENFWRPFAGLEENFEGLWDDCHWALQHIQFERSRMFSCGYSRGGDSSWGGPIWLDFGLEFQDNLPLPQLVGHSHDKMIRQRGKSFCTDAPGAYALIAKDGSIQFKILRYLETRNEAGEKIWVEEEPKIEVLS